MIDISCILDFQILQIYNEKIYDLLHDKKRQNPLPIREGGNSDTWANVHVRGLSVYRIDSKEDAFRLIKKAIRNKAVRSTDFNNVSSRAHTVLQIFTSIEEDSSDGLKIVRKSTLSLVDLAGSEKWRASLSVSSTNPAASETDAQVKEMTNINTSLHVLGNCISGLIENDRRHIPYRDSVLTRLLQTTLSGQGKSIIVATIHSDADYLDENYSTLQFASRASKIKVSLSANWSVMGQDERWNLAEAQKTIKQLRQQLLDAGKGVSLLSSQSLTVKGQCGSCVDSAQRMEGLEKKVETLVAENERLKALVASLGGTVSLAVNAANASVNATTSGAATPTASTLRTSKEQNWLVTTCSTANTAPVSTASEVGIAEEASVSSTSEREKEKEIRLSKKMKALMMGELGTSASTPRPLGGDVRASSSSTSLGPGTNSTAVNVVNSMPSPTPVRAPSYSSSSNYTTSTNSGNVSSSRPNTGTRGGSSGTTVTSDLLGIGNMSATNNLTSPYTGASMYSGTTNNNPIPLRSSLNVNASVSSMAGAGLNTSAASAQSGIAYSPSASISSLPYIQQPLLSSALPSTNVGHSTSNTRQSNSGSVGGSINQQQHLTQPLTQSYISSYNSQYGMQSTTQTQPVQSQTITQPQASAYGSYSSTAGLAVPNSADTSVSTTQYQQYSASSPYASYSSTTGFTANTNTSAVNASTTSVPSVTGSTSSALRASNRVPYTNPFDPSMSTGGTATSSGAGDTAGMNSSMRLSRNANASLTTPNAATATDSGAAATGAGVCAKHGLEDCVLCKMFGGTFTSAGSTIGGTVASKTSDYDYIGSLSPSPSKSPTKSPAKNIPPMFSSAGAQVITPLANTGTASNTAYGASSPYGHYSGYTNVFSQQTPSQSHTQTQPQASPYSYTGVSGNAGGASPYSSYSQYSTGSGGQYTPSTQYTPGQYTSQYNVSQYSTATTSNSSSVVKTSSNGNSGSDGAGRKKHNKHKSSSSRHKYRAQQASIAEGEEDDAADSDADGEDSDDDGFKPTQGEDPTNNCQAHGLADCLLCNSNLSASFSVSRAGSLSFAQGSLVSGYGSAASSGAGSIQSITQQNLSAILPPMSSDGVTMNLGASMSSLQGMLPQFVSTLDSAEVKGNAYGFNSSSGNYNPGTLAGRAQQSLTQSQTQSTGSSRVVKEIKSISAMRGSATGNAAASQQGVPPPLYEQPFPRSSSSPLPLPLSHSQSHSAQHPSSTAPASAGSSPSQQHQHGYTGVSNGGYPDGAVPSKIVWEEDEDDLDDGDDYAPLGVGGTAPSGVPVKEKKLKKVKKKKKDGSVSKPKSSVQSHVSGAAAASAYGAAPFALRPLSSHKGSAAVSTSSHVPAVMQTPVAKENKEKKNKQRVLS